MNRCPELEQWIAFHTGELDEEQSDGLHAHLSSCVECRTVLDTLVAHEALADRLREAVECSDRDVPTPPATIGAAPAVGRDDIDEYSIIREISRTHFSIVYEATQKGTGQRVALKVLLASTAADDRGRLRFEREVELLALLRHPSIVPIYNSGLYGGQYYFVMPYIKGQPPDAFAADAALSLRERVELIHTICVAVNYAHQRGVMHRDLKPSNILVDESGDVHILDFGLAKINSDQRKQSEATLTLESGQIIGTPAYMSPEQAEGRTQDIDIRSDVYSLGVIMYRIFLGRMPYTVDTGLTQILRNIQISEPVKPRAVDRTFNRELEAITLKSLEKEPDRRYQSAAALAEDLNRFLTRQPVLARSPSALYHFRKLVARHKVPFALLALVFVLLAGFAVTATVQANRVARERDIKRDVTDFFIESFIRSADPMRGGRSDVTVLDMLQDTAEAVEAGFLEQPLLKAELRDAVGYMDKELEHYEDAEALLRKALNTRRERLGDNHLDVAETSHNLAAALYGQGRYAEAKELYLRALRIRREKLGPRSPEVAETLNHLAVLATTVHDYETAERHFNELLPICNALETDDDAIGARAVHNYAHFLWKVGRLDEAEQHFRDAITRFKKRYGELHAYVAIAMHNLARCLEQKALASHKAEGLAEAEQLYKSSIAMKRKVFQQNKRSIATSLYRLAELQYHEGNLDGALTHGREALAIHRQRVPGTLQTSDTLLLLGSISMAHTLPTEAIPFLAEALGIRQAVGATKSLESDTLRTKLRDCLARVPNPAEIENEFIDEYNNAVMANGEAHADTRRAQYRLIGYYDASNRPDEAARYARSLRLNHDPTDH